MSSRPGRANLRAPPPIVAVRPPLQDGAGPSVAVELVGLNGLPAAGDQLMVVEDEAKARAVADVRQALDREKRASQLFASRSTADRELFLGGLKEGELPTKLVDMVVKADVQGSAEAL